MGENKLDSLLSGMNKNRREQFYTYFKNAPDWLWDNFSVEKVKKGKVFIREGNPVDTIYFIIDGYIKATDYRVYGIKFDFILFTDVYAYGGMEVIMELDKYRASLETVTDCTILKIPKSTFERWMNTDIKALAHESKLMGNYLLEQARSVRAFLFLQGVDRLAMLFENRYKKFAVNGVLKVKNDREELSDYTGLSVKTVTRAVKKMEKEGLVTRDGNWIVIDKEHYQAIKDALSQVFSEDA